jgi:threonine synthase
MAGTTFATGLRCRICGEGYPLEAIHACERCFGPLEVVYDYPAVRNAISRESIAAGPRTIWRYRALLPVATETPVDLGVGCTPLIKADRLGRALGLDNLYLKNDCVNPTYSFKDRVVAVAATRAVELGLDTFACASTGNLACAVAAASTVAGLKCFVFVPADLELSKVINALVYGPNLVQVEGNYDQVNRLCSELADEYGWGFANVNLRPYYAEGSKTLAFEVAEQLGWEAPDHVVVPVASGALMVKIEKGFRELEQVGLIAPRAIRFSGAQAEGCSPVATAFAEGSDDVRPVKPNTFVRSLAIGDPADGPFALQLARRTDGAIGAASDPEVAAGISLLARTEGIFAETAGGTTIAVLKKLAEQGIVKRHERVVAYITGNGLKTPDAVAAELSTPFKIAPTLSAFEDQVLNGARQLAGVR